MTKRKQSIRKKGKISLSEYFKKLNMGEVVSIKKEANINSSFPNRISSNLGKIVGKRGAYFLVEIGSGKKSKEFLIHPINLRRTK